MARIPAGTFTLRRNATTSYHFEFQHGFYIGVTEVTNAQWRTVMGREPPSKWGDDDRPVEQVKLLEAAEFCRELTSHPTEQKAGRRYRLPTEAEWEYACRAGVTTDFPSGDHAFKDDLADLGWFAFNSNNETHSVGSKQPNKWGLYDTLGNVAEWCTYCTGIYYKPENKGGVSVIGPNSVGCGKGGSYESNTIIGSAGEYSQYWDNPTYRDYERRSQLGFRVVMIPPSGD